ncbi:MAG: sterol desaturase family protein, partial [bacterium]
MMQVVFPVTFLPEFSAWHSGVLPYPVLVCIQILVAVSGAAYIYKLQAGQIPENAATGSLFLVLGGIYFTSMVFRLIAGLSLAGNSTWFSAILPSVFHIALAAYLIAAGFYHKRGSAQFIAWAAYPLTISLVVLGHILLIDLGSNLTVATLTPVLFGAIAITLLEYFFPYRQQWRPVAKDMLNDAAYMLLVQNVLPKFLGFTVAILMLGGIQNGSQSINGLWPHHWSLFAQVILMLIAAEFVRYWLHRMSHSWSPLWRFHAVHHSPHKVYWMNVGRFHPFEKSLQYVFDTLPFLILGVSENVLALYFVFYATNGFFQHCNISVRLGFFNYIVSGPELHRWHHSKIAKQSNHNFGNNLIIWDLLFGTWFLPKGKAVTELGLINRNYPDTLPDQLRAPFIKGLDKHRSEDAS